MKPRTRGPLRYALYPRCSSDDQAHRDFSTIDVQRELNAQHVRSQGGVLVRTDYSDEGYSGTNLKRPGWQRLLTDAQAGQFDVVVVTYMSRLGRGDTFTVAEYLLKECGVRVEMVKEQFTDDLAGYINKAMTRFVDGMYVENVRQWTKTKMEQMVAQGYWCGVLPTLGYRMQSVMETGILSRSDKEPPKRLVIHEGEAEIVRCAYALYLEKRQIAAVRDYLRVVTSRSWTTTTTKHLLTNEVFLGVQKFGLWRNESAHPPIVDPQTWHAVQQALQQRGGSRAPISHDYLYYLRGLVVCPHCGCRCTPYSAKSRQAHYYACLFDLKRKTDCPVKRINADALHVSVLREIARAARHKSVMHQIIAQTDGWSEPDGELRSVRGQLGKRKQFVAVQIGNITRAIAEGRPMKSLLATLEKLEAEQEAICRELERVEAEIEQATVRRPTVSEVQEAWSEIVDLWDEATEEERQVLMAAVVKRVDVEEKERVALQLSPFAEPHAHRFEINSHVGAGAGLEPATFGL